MNKVSFSNIVKLIKTQDKSVKFFITASNLNITDNEGCNFLFYAIEFNNRSVFNLLIKKGIDYNKVNDYGTTPLELSIYLENLYFIKKLILLNAKVQEGLTPLHLACSYGNLKIVKYLSSYQDINSLDLRESTPIRFAVQENYLKIVKFLIAEGANVHAKNDVTDNLLLSAAGEGHYQLVKYFVNNFHSEFKGKFKQAIKLANSYGHSKIAAYIASR